jgi:small subunit ribosomal protein S8
MNTDPIADLLTRIRNAVKAGHERVVVPHSKLKMAVLAVLKQGQYINDYKQDGRDILVALNPERHQIHLKRISKPGQRIYKKSKDLKPVLEGYGIGVISTPQGVMTTGEAYKKHLGGEVICEVW